ncbi:hypothetical protein [Neorhizobium vignae]|uniref:pPIWI-associating nuclease domain-containing protein n=1 Tax=Neorhizobium vignae TaxID=690585 RepID=UPI00055B4201|nr:hypothetical protein [Neorhizobium vignae]
MTASTRLLGLADLKIDGFSKDALTAASMVLADGKNPLRLVFFSVSIRVLLEHIMGTLAPSDDVESCSWYRKEPERDGPVRAQRIQYWLQGGLTDEFLSTELGFDPRPIRSRVLRSFNRLSKHVHARQGTLISDLNLQDQEVAPVVDDLVDLYTAYFEYRSALIEPLVESLDEEAVDDLMSETIQSLDEIATHHGIEEIYTESTEVVEITSASVRYRASGSITVSLQWGSNSDVRRGDGAEMDKSFPFSCDFVVPTEDPRNLTLAEIVSGVDTDSWWSGWNDE